MCDELTSVEAERDGALELLKLRTAELVYLANAVCHEPCLGCRRVLDSIMDHFSNPSMPLLYGQDLRPEEERRKRRLK
jgi:hypothetical protein